jgi:hypothetical protein
MLTGDYKNMFYCAHGMKPATLLAAAIVATIAGPNPGYGRTAECEQRQPEVSDTSLAGATRDSSRNVHWLTIDIMVGKQFLSTKWEPYTQPLFVGGSCQRRFDESPLWLDASILVGRAGGVDQAGAGNGPGVSLVDLHAGIGHWWDLESLPLSFFVSWGIEYVWANLRLWEGEHEGHFWGGYARSGIAIPLSEELYLGIGLTGTVTTRRTLMDRYLSMNAIALALSVGARL